MKRQGSTSKKSTSTTSRVSRKTSAVAPSTSRVSASMSTLSSSVSSSRASATSAAVTKVGRVAAASTSKRAASSAASRRTVSSFSNASYNNDVSFAPSVSAAVVAPVEVSSKKMAFSAAPSFKASAVVAAAPKTSSMKLRARAFKSAAPSMKMASVATTSAAATTDVAVAPTPAFRASLKAFDREAQPQSLSPQKIVFQAQKFIMNDVSGLQKEFKADLNDTLDNLGIQVTVNEDGVITATFKRRGFDVEAVFDREFQFPDEDEYEDEYDENDAEGGQAKRRGGSGSGSENEDYDDDSTPEPYHNITFSLMKDGQTLKMGGTLALDGDLRVTSFTPYTKRGEELRTVATEDLSDATLNALFDALEMVCLQDDTTNALLDVARQERVKTHIDALTWMNEFFDLGDYN